jgi:ribosomal-protein-alanine N-acetyltransferase
MNENREFLEHWEPVREQGFFTLDAQVADIEAAVADAAADRRHAFGIFLDSELVGRIALSQIFRGIFQNAYLGYSIAERWNGHGLATEAVGVVMEFAFGDLGLHRVQAAVMPRNAGSIRVLEKNGFRLCGTERKSVLVRDGMHDGAAYELLAEDLTAGG